LKEIPNRWGGRQTPSGKTGFGGGHKRTGYAQPDVYWSGTEYAPNTNNAWNFNSNDGNQNNDDKDNDNYAWAVRPGE
jgi:hypothetical protein